MNPALLRNFSLADDRSPYHERGGGLGDWKVNHFENATPPPPKKNQIVPFTSVTTYHPFTLCILETFITHLLLHIHQKKEIALEITSKRGFKVSTMYLVVLVVSDYCNKSTFFRLCHSCRIVEAYQPLRLQIIRWEWNSGTMFPLRCFMFIKLRLSPSLWLAGHCEFLFLLAGVRKVFYQQRKTVLNIWKMAR